jgi:tRNA (guanine10-N2)-dimethyltransferase
LAKLFFLLSGEHETLPVSEIKAILEAEGYTYKISEKLDQVLRIEADPKCIEAVKRRAAFTKLCGLELFVCEADLSQALKALQSINIDEILNEGESFAVRIKHVKNYAPELDTMFLERKIGECVLQMRKSAEVNLKNPDKTFLGALTENKLVFGLKTAEIPSKPFMERRPRKKPFFHPSAMPPKLARVMVNLARAKAGELVFDPFCGTGGILIEAALIGCRVLGLDAQRRMVRGCKLNFAYYGVSPEGLMVADACKPPVTKVDCMIADPPYGRSATTLKRPTKKIIEDFLKAAKDLLVSGKKVCIAAPKTIEVSRIGVAQGYRHIESHYVYIHRGLTREIAVLECV